MNLTNFTEIIASNLNNKDCAFMTGVFYGNFLTLRLVLVYIVIGFIMGVMTKFGSIFFDWLRIRLIGRKK